MGNEAERVGQNGGQNESRHEDQQEGGETGEERVEIQLPKGNQLGEKESILKWLEGTISPTPGVDFEMEELVSSFHSLGMMDLADGIITKFSPFSEININNLFRSKTFHVNF